MTPATEGRRRVTVLPVDGRVPYREALEWQRHAARRRIDGDLDADLLLLLEHEPVLTLGRGASADHVVADADRLAGDGIPLVEVERGGDVTYHGPGQLVGYPIMDLRAHRKDLHWYLRRLEGSLIRALDRLGLAAFRVDGHTGVWVGESDSLPEDGNPERLIADGRIRKVASIGVHVSRWVTWHGFALNVTRKPLEAFGLIVPCGIAGVHMTSLAEEGAAAPMEEVRGAVADGFGRSFGVTTREREPVPWSVLERPARSRTRGPAEPASA